jgi:hypothetical protein
MEQALILLLSLAFEMPQHQIASNSIEALKTHVKKY